MSEAPDDPRDDPQDKGRVRHRTLGVSDKTVKLARALRMKMSLPEVLLWQHLKGKPLGMKFRKQHGLLTGHVADFACVEVRLLIEVDGIAHDMGDRPERDEARTAELEDLGWRVIRFTAKDVLKDAAAVAESIVDLALSRLPLHHPARAGRSPSPRQARRGFQEEI